MDRELPGRAPAWYPPPVTISESDLKTGGDGSPLKAGPAIAIWIVASLFALVSFGVVLTLAHLAGLPNDDLYMHDTVVVLPRPMVIAAATFAGYLALSYLASFYVRAALPKVGSRWLKLSACGAAFDAALAYVSTAHVADILGIGGKQVFDAARLDRLTLIWLAMAAALGIAQAIALAPAGRRFVWWPFVVIAAAGVAKAIGASIRGPLPIAIAFVLGTAAAGVVLGAGFVVTARSVPRR